MPHTPPYPSLPRCAAKYADLVLLLIDGGFGFEMETFELLNLLQVGGCDLQFLFWLGVAVLLWRPLRCSACCRHAGGLVWFVCVYGLCACKAAGGAGRAGLARRC